ncbi:MAG TPA: NAD-dependent epimerase/dehydratase family protein [Mycobacteriales bacterium]|nr:NAD-dependent epimerase/dehydratase family protein [Mycobacteriales bacterium]
MWSALLNDGVRPASEAELEELLSTPSAGLVAELGTLTGDLLILGAGGKMGPTMARMARRALDLAGRDDVDVIAVSRWSDTAAADRLRAAGVRVEVADVTVDSDLSALPEAANVVYLIGAKFGVSANPHTAWTVNAVLPALVGRRYAKSRLAVLSTGNVYPLTPVEAGGPTESDPTGPVGEYAMSCLGRERAVDAVSAEHGTAAAIIRLNYAVELRYGVLADLATRIHAGTPIDLATGHVNVVWQRYASEVALRSLLHASNPPFVLNLTGPETVSVRRVATRLGELLGAEPVFTGEPAPTALLSNAGRCHALFGYPDIALDTLVAWQAGWLLAGGELWAKATKFERRDGRF